MYGDKEWMFGDSTFISILCWDQLVLGAQMDIGGCWLSLKVGWFDTESDLLGQGATFCSHACLQNK